MAQALIDRPVRMPKRPEQQTPWNYNRGAKNRLVLETTNDYDYPDMFLLEDNTNGENYITLEH